MQVDYEFDENAKKIAETIVKEKYKKFFDERFDELDLDKVAFVKCYAERTVESMESDKDVNAQCIALNSLTRLISQFKYAILIFPTFEDLNDAEKTRVIFHELLHIPPDFERMKLIEHDVEEFKEIMDRFG